MPARTQRAAVGVALGERSSPAPLAAAGMGSPHGVAYDRDTCRQTRKPGAFLLPGGYVCHTRALAGFVPMRAAATDAASEPLLLDASINVEVATAYRNTTPSRRPSHARAFDSRSLLRGALPRAP